MRLNLKYVMISDHALTCVHGHATDARPRNDVLEVSIKDRKFLFHTSECRGKRIQLLSSCDAINQHACLKRARDHDLAICIYMQGRYIRDQDNRGPVQSSKVRPTE